MKKIFLALLISITAHATLNDVEKAQVFPKNLLVNGGFENGKAGWSASAGTFAVTTSSPMIGKVHATWDAAASADTLMTSAVTIKPGYYGRNGVVSCLITTASGTATHTIQAYDGTNILSSVDITSSTIPTRASANFIFPSSGSIFLRVYANADEVEIKIDDCFLGPAEGFNVSNISQATFVGSAYYATTTNCQWTRANTSLGAFGTDTDCPSPTVEFNPGPGTISTTDADLPQFTVSNLPPGAYKVLISGHAGMTGAGGLTAFTISDGATTSGRGAVESSLSTHDGFFVEGIFVYTAAGSKTFALHGSSSANTLNIYNLANNERLEFKLYRYPLTSEQAYRPDMSAMSWSGYHDQTCSWNNTGSSYDDPTADATCTLTERTNQNFGTVTTYTVTNAMPGITFTPKKAGRYYICARVQATPATANTIQMRLWDGTTVITQDRVVHPTNYTLPHNLCGIYVAASTASVSLRVQQLVDSSDVTINSPSAVTTSYPIEWSIFAIDQSLPAPLLANSVTSSSSGVTKINAANVTCSSSSSIVSQRGSWVSSIGNISSGACTVTLVTGVYSATPYCWLGVQNLSAAVLGSAVLASSATSVSIDCEIEGAAGCSAWDTYLFCMGAP